MNAERLLAMAFPNESRVELHEIRQPAVPKTPRLVLLQRRDPVTAWRELRRMLRTVPGLELRTDGRGGV